MRAILAAGAVALIALSVAGCGRMGELERPSARESQRAPRSASAPDIVEPATINRPATQQPIDGGPNNPFGGSGAYPREPGAQ
jgi:predicted small lipoprotein YifL